MSMGVYIEGPLYIIYGKGMTLLPMELLNLQSLLCNFQTLILYFTKEFFDLVL
jgi:hypothetical protein